VKAVGVNGGGWVGLIGSWGCVLVGCCLGGLGGGVCGVGVGGGGGGGSEGAAYVVLFAVFV